MQSVKPQVMLSTLGTAVLRAQPLLTFPIFLSVLLGTPPLWLSWLIAIIPWPLRFFITGRLTQRTPFDIPILVSIAGMLLGFFLSPDHQLSVPVLHTYLACVLFYYGIVNNSRARSGYWVSIAVFLCLILFFLTAWVFTSSEGAHTVFNSWAYEAASSLPRPLNMSPNVNVLGGAFAVVIPGLVAIALFRQRTWVRWSADILAVIFGGILVLSTSGGGLIVTTVAILIVLFWRNVKMFWGVFLALGVTIGATSSIWNNASWLAEVFSFQVLFSRLERWQATVAALKDSPLTGLGLGGWWSKVPAYGMNGGPHSAYLQLFSDTGALGAIAFVMAVIVGGKLLWQILHADKDTPIYGITVGIVAGIIAGGIHALIDDNMNVLIPIGNEYLYFAVPLLWLLAALLVVSYQHLLGDIETDKRIGPF